MYSRIVLRIGEASNLGPAHADPFGEDDVFDDPEWQLLNLDLPTEQGFEAWDPPPPTTWWTTCRSPTR